MTCFSKELCRIPFDLDQLDLIQDEGLDVIAEGLDTLKDMAHDMNEVCSLTILLHM